MGLFSNIIGGASDGSIMSDTEETKLENEPMSVAEHLDIQTNTIEENDTAEEEKDEDEDLTLPLYHYTVVLVNGAEYDVIATSVEYDEDDETLTFYTNDPNEPGDEEACAGFKMNLVVCYGRTKPATSDELVTFATLVRKDTPISNMIVGDNNE